MNILDNPGIQGMGSVSGILNKSRAEKNREQQDAVKKGKEAAADPKKTDAKLRGVAEDFVGVFMNQVMKAMRATVNQNPSMHGDNGEKFFQEMADTEYAKLSAKGHGYGLTDLVYNALVNKSRLHPAADNKTENPQADAGAEKVGV